MTAFSNARACGIGAVLLAALSTVYAQGGYPVTATQRATAQQVAQQGVPLSDLSPTAPDQYTVKRGDTLWGISGLFLRQPRKARVRPHLRRPPPRRPPAAASR